MEIAAKLNDTKYSQAISRGSSSGASKKRHQSISPPPSPEYPPFKKRKLDLTPSPPEFIPSSQPNSVGDSIDGPTASTVAVLRSSPALPLLHSTPFTPTQARYKLNNQVSPVPTPCPPEQQKANHARSQSSRSTEDTNRVLNYPQAANNTEYSRASFPQTPQIPPGLEPRKTSYQVGIVSYSPQEFSLDLCLAYFADYQPISPPHVVCVRRNSEHRSTNTSYRNCSLPATRNSSVCASEFKAQADEAHD